ncbi:hypothetical protein PROFUN_03885 [Planoprotostelium fungivorum]|uniref:Uncharacterized protein n=1 Tax=Planoprotostelium fungivorum TaxID=1890364 RepID=A0A2P6MTL6_9EUKA|nr:hypothetical protein PROFUN_03885 [Planoprotostelium fungivorum]
MALCHISTIIPLSIKSQSICTVQSNLTAMSCALTYFLKECTCTYLLKKRYQLLRMPNENGVVTTVRHKTKSVRDHGRTKKLTQLQRSEFPPEFPTFEKHTLFTEHFTGSFHDFYWTFLRSKDLKWKISSKIVSFLLCVRLYLSRDQTNIF